jgi:hypothetical protein
MDKRKDKFVVNGHFVLAQCRLLHSEANEPFREHFRTPPKQWARHWKLEACRGSWYIARHGRIQSFPAQITHTLRERISRVPKRDLLCHNILWFGPALTSLPAFYLSRSCPDQFALAWTEKGQSSSLRLVRIAKDHKIAHRHRPTIISKEKKNASLQEIVSSLYRVLLLWQKIDGRCGGLPLH